MPGADLAGEKAKQCRPSPAPHSSLPQDSFYKPLTPEERANVKTYNFDNPEAFDTQALMECMLELKAGRPYDVPIYDFTTHSRRWAAAAAVPAARCRPRLAAAAS